MRLMVARILLGTCKLCRYARSMTKPRKVTIKTATDYKCGNWSVSLGTQNTYDICFDGEPLMCDGMTRSEMLDLQTALAAALEAKG